MKQFLWTISAFLLTLGLDGIAQGTSLEEQDPTYVDWFNKDPKVDKVAGVSVDRVYKKLLKDQRPKKTVLVAVIDGGVDIEHEDFEGKIWINEGEVPNNGIDDDGNGYVDDIHGWNFLGNVNGENLHYENLEETRIVAKADLDDPLYASAKLAYDRQLEESVSFRDQISAYAEVFLEAKETVKKWTGIEVKSVADLDEIKVDVQDQDLDFAIQLLRGRYEMGFTDDYVREAVQYSIEHMDYYLETDFRPRKVIGDDPYDINDVGYGNPDVRGPDASHGTAVAGVIAAVRGNAVGINGVTDFVKIMAIRAVPQGDERDKDVALAIRYAVDNGADIINMSFGKDFSPQKHFVDDAVQYAEEKGVLLVHASGNDGRDIDVTDNFPTPNFKEGGKATNWLEIGANDQYFDEYIAASFSNYGKKQVDIFAPGASIISLDLDNTYSRHDGTSLSAPVVTGVAALILAYYPELSPSQLIGLLMDTARSPKKPKRVLQPSDYGDQVMVSFKDLSRSGGILNAYDAMKLAMKRFQ